jgi:hypothetical protein
MKALIISSLVCIFSIMVINNLHSQQYNDNRNSSPNKYSASGSETKFKKLLYHVLGNPGALKGKGHVAMVKSTNKKSLKFYLSKGYKDYTGAVSLKKAQAKFLQLTKQYKK